MCKSLQEFRRCFGVILLVLLELAFRHCLTVSHVKVNSYLESLDMLPDPNELELDERSPGGREDDYERCV